MRLMSHETVTSHTIRWNTQSAFQYGLRKHDIGNAGKSCHCQQCGLLEDHHSAVLNGESPKRLAPPRNTEDRKHPQSTQTVNRHNTQTKHQALTKGQPGSLDVKYQSAQQPCTPSAQQQLALVTHTQQGHHQISSAHAAPRCEAQAGRATLHRRHHPPQHTAPTAPGGPIIRSGRWTAVR